MVLKNDFDGRRRFSELGSIFLYFIGISLPYRLVMRNFDDDLMFGTYRLHRPR